MGDFLFQLFVVVFVLFRLRLIPESFTVAGRRHAALVYR